MSSTRVNRSKGLVRTYQQVDLCYQQWQGGKWRTTVCSSMDEVAALLQAGEGRGFQCRAERVTREVFTSRQTGKKCPASLRPRPCSPPKR